FWRSATHWIGGVGIIVFALSVLPSIGKVGMILYRAEMSPIAMANFRYRTQKTLHIIMMIYAGLTLLEIIALMLCGMNLFDAITHSFATIATGGFSPKNISIAYYNSLAVEVVIMIFMLLSGINFGLLFLTVSGKILVLLRSTVVRYYLIAILAGVIASAVNLHGSVYTDWFDAFRYASFQLISIGTSTGFATTDSNLWPPFSKLLIIFFTLQCACSASTSGGIKVDRIVLFWQALWKRIKKVQHANAVVKVKVDNVTVEDDTIEASIVYILLYLFIVFVSALIISGLGLDIMTAFSAAAATMGNVGPGFGSVGSVSNFSQIPELAKWILTGDMLLGRLEIFGLLLLFLMKTWR
ncbi:MAG: TrkH family potassium uptake protein, partial [Deltaproteobacteria bacterium]|nr:TrkH family potassium uptake protein [Deltaproteobacteria bacterium]